MALLLAEGSGNREISRRLALSARTVRTHVARVLAAYGVATRTDLPGLMREHLEPATAVPPLTTRQQQVSMLVAGGASNRDIARVLGISQSAVEKHISAIRRAWGVSSRAGIAATIVRMEPRWGRVVSGDE